MSNSIELGKKQSLGILLATGLAEASFHQAIHLARSAQIAGIQVYLYLLDDAIGASASPELQSLADCGVKISGCAYAAKRRSIKLHPEISFGGLGLLNEIIARCDCFVGFCQD